MTCMLCLQCNSKKFTAKDVATPQCFRGEEFTVNAPAMVCVKCQWATMTDAQADELAKITADEYRRRHGLLTGVEIVAFRKKLGMGQRAFATFLEVGIASVKRWETGFVQEKVYDQLIRAKCTAANGPAPAKAVDCAVPPTQFRFHSFRVETATVIPMRYQIHAGQCAISLSGGSGMSGKIDLSDGHPWRASHFSANDPALCPTA
jgi:putative zinc finger/helix-turn-helix YgiT family protein